MLQAEEDLSLDNLIAEAISADNLTELKKCMKTRRSLLKDDAVNAELNIHRATAGFTPVNFSAVCNALESFKFLVNIKAEPLLQNSYEAPICPGFNAMECAAYAGAYTMLEYLLKNYGLGVTTFRLLVLLIDAYPVYKNDQERIQIAQLLLNNDQNIYVIDENRETIFDIWTSFDSTEHLEKFKFFERLMAASNIIINYQKQIAYRWREGVEYTLPFLANLFFNLIERDFTTNDTIADYLELIDYLIIYKKIDPGEFIEFGKYKKTNPLEMLIEAITSSNDEIHDLIYTHILGTILSVYPHYATRSLVKLLEVKGGIYVALNRLIELNQLREISEIYTARITARQRLMADAKIQAVFFKQVTPPASPLTLKRSHDLLAKQPLSKQQKQEDKLLPNQLEIKI